MDWFDKLKGMCGAGILSVALFGTGAYVLDHAFDTYHQFISVVAGMLFAAWAMKGVGSDVGGSTVSRSATD